MGWEDSEDCGNCGQLRLDSWASLDFRGPVSLKEPKLYFLDSRGSAKFTRTSHDKLGITGKSCE